LRFVGEDGISAPERRASLKPIAIACFRLFTFFPLRPDSSFLCLYSSIVRFIFFFTMPFDRGVEPEDVFFFAAI